MTKEEKQEQGKPVAWWNGEEGVVFAHDQICIPNWTDHYYIPLYTTPQYRKPLTDEQIVAIVREASHGSAIRRDGSTSMRIARAIESAHGIKE